MNRRLRNFTWWVALLALAGAAGCALRAGGPDGVGRELEQAAAAFRTAMPSRRGEAGERMAALLPHCPVRRQTDLGTGHITVLDYEHPSFVLPEGRVVKLLGKPDAVIDGNYIYLICRESKYTAYLEVEIQAGRVVTAQITGGL